MADAKAAPGKVAGRKELNPLVIVDQINKELLRQRNYGLEWGALVPDYPKTADAYLAARRAELAALTTGKPGSAPAAAAAASAYSTTTRAAFPERATLGGLETGLGSAYRTLKAGV